MHQHAHAGLAEDGVDGGAVDVHDLHGLRLVGRLAFATGLLRHRQAFRNGLSQEFGLPARIADHLAKLLVRGVVCTELVAVSQQHLAEIRFQQGGFGQQLGAHRVGQFFPDQEVAIAAAQPDRDARGGFPPRRQHPKMAPGSSRAAASSCAACKKARKASEVAGGGGPARGRGRR
ncbi:hypothetical protein G6F68_015267 [Rhizopus microsporus]|nr:hypothetical protein G6F68_015267 [Rhizopus microsporus]